MGAKALRLKVRAIDPDLGPNAQVTDYTTESEALKKECEAITSDEVVKRFAESVSLMATGWAKRMKTTINEELTRELLGCGAFDGIVYDEKYKDAFRIEMAFKRGGDPFGRDAPKMGNTLPHTMAGSGDLRWHTESWHLERLTALRKRGCDNRGAADMQGRAPLLLGFERYNVLFVKAILRSEMGETWNQRKLKRVPAYAHQGRLMKELLSQQKSGGSVASIMGRRVFDRGNPNQSVKEELLHLVQKGKATSVYRMGYGSWMSALHWAAYWDNSEAIYLLYDLGLPINSSNAPVNANSNSNSTTSHADVAAAGGGGTPTNGGGGGGGGNNTRISCFNSFLQVSDDNRKFIHPEMETALLTAVTNDSEKAVTALLKCKAQPNQRNSVGESPLSMAAVKTTGTMQMILSSLHNPVSDDDRKSYKSGYDLGFDAVYAVADMLDRNVIEVSSIEDLCSWYVGFSPISFERVLKFWQFYETAKGPGPGPGAGVSSTATAASPTKSVVPAPASPPSPASVEK